MWRDDGKQDKRFASGCSRRSHDLVGHRLAQGLRVLLLQGGQLDPIDLLVEERFHRAAPGGNGAVKAAGNYSPVRALRGVLGLQKLFVMPCSMCAIELPAAISQCATVWRCGCWFAMIAVL